MSVHLSCLGEISAGARAHPLYTPMKKYNSICVGSFRRAGKGKYDQRGEVAAQVTVTKPEFWPVVLWNTILSWSSIFFFPLLPRGWDRVAANIYSEGQT